MILSLTRYNQALQLAILGAGALYMFLFIWTYLQSTGDNADTLSVPSYSPPAQVAVDYPVIGRNVFDPSGQAWQTSEKAKRFAGNAAPAAANGDIKGVIKIPGVEGVLMGKEFVPVGKSLLGGNLEKVEGGKAQISGGSAKEVDLNAVREQQKQSLGIKIE